MVKGLLNEYNLMFYCFLMVIFSQLLIILLKGWSFFVIERSLYTQH